MPDLTPEEYFAPFSQITADFAAFCSKMSDPLPLYLRMNTLKTPVRESRWRLEQQDIVLTAFDLLKVGGTLVYSTCTYSPEENKSAVLLLLNTRPAEIQPIAINLPHSPGLQQWKETSYDSSIKYCWRICPHQIDTVGYFMARVVKGS
jgi:16S rRNA C967 or C1407 C5-methylase (RsmB/RsmF family)